MYLCQHGVTLTYVSPIEIVIIGGAQFKHMLNIGTVPIFVFWDPLNNETGRGRVIKYITLLLFVNH